MILPVFALVIFFGASNGGRAINTDLKFSTREACEQAAARINASVQYPNFGPFSHCVEVK